MVMTLTRSYVTGRNVQSARTCRDPRRRGSYSVAGMLLPCFSGWRCALPVVNVKVTIFPDFENLAPFTRV